MAKRQRIKIYESSDLLDIIEDMFDEFVQSMFEDDKYTSPIEENRFIYEEECITRLWDAKGCSIVERYLKRMQIVFEKNFPGNEFKVYSTYYKKW